MAKFTRKGLHRFECESCGEALYATVPAVERRGLPVCWCGETTVPANIETALVLPAELVSDTWQEAILQRTHNKELSQARSLGRNKLELKRSAGTLNDMYGAAVDEIVAEQRADARRRRVAALLPVPEPIPF